MPLVPAEPIAQTPLTGLTSSEVAEQRIHTPEERAGEATAQARWLLERAGNGGVPLTQTYALARAVVRDQPVAFGADNNRRRWIFVRIRRHLRKGVP